MWKQKSDEHLFEYFKDKDSSFDQSFESLIF